MTKTIDGSIIKTKRKYPINELFELMQRNLQEKFGSMSLENEIIYWEQKEKHKLGQTIVVKGVDGFLNFVESSSKIIMIRQINEEALDKSTKEKLTLSGVIVIAGVVAGSIAKDVAGKVLTNVVNDIGLGGVARFAGGVANTVGVISRASKFASEKKRRDASEGDWGVIDELSKDIEKLVEVKTGGCYIATCVYGSYNCSEVYTLRRFRDTILSSSWLGRQAIQVYYLISPKIVNSFGNKKWFNELCKPILNKIVKKLQEKGIDSSFYSD